MNNGNTQPTPSVSPLDESLERYDRALSELESYAKVLSKPESGTEASSEPTEALKNLFFEHIVEVLVARDGVEKKRVEDENPSGKSIAKLIELDRRLKAQRQAIATQPELSEWKQNLNIPSTNWWWDLAQLEPELNQALQEYEQAIVELEKAPEPDSNLLFIMLSARDVVEECCRKEKKLSPDSIEKISQLDKRLKKQDKAIAKDESLDERKNILNKHTWWWQLTDPEAIPNKAVDNYEKALLTLESATPNPTSEYIRDVLLSRDEVEQIFREKKQPPQRIDKIMELDERLWAQAEAIAKEGQVEKWKVHFNPPESSWWWQIATEAPYLTPYLNQCVKRYKNALKEVENVPNPTKLETLRLLKARDALEKAIKNQPSVPEVISHKITELDQRLKQQRLALTRGNQLINWKKSLNPPESNWWWNFKPTLFGDEEEPLPLRDRLWILAALACIGIAAGFVVNTTQTFQGSTSKDKNIEAVGSDAAQNSLVILQGAGLLGLSASAVTKRGQKMVESLITNIPFICPSWHAPATFGLSLMALGVTYSINESLPLLGNWYFDQGKQLAEANQLFQAQEKYSQANKFFTDTDDKAQLRLSLGKISEQQGNLTEAINLYKSALATDNAEVRLEVMNCLGRAKLLEGWQKVGWTNKITDEGLIREVQSYFQLVENKIQKTLIENNSTISNNRASSKQVGAKETNNHKKQAKKGIDLKKGILPNKQLEKELYINKGIFAWSKANLSKIDFKDLDHDNDLLQTAKETFAKATTIENDLPTNLDGRKARCYQEIVEAILSFKKQENNQNKLAKELEILQSKLRPSQEEFKNIQKLQKGLMVQAGENLKIPNLLYCKKILNYVNDINDVNIMSKYRELIDNSKYKLIKNNESLIKANQKLINSQKIEK